MIFQQQNFQYIQFLSSIYKTTRINFLSFESFNKKKESRFNLDHRKPSENNVQAREEEEQGKETIRAVVAGLVNKYFQIQILGKKEMNKLE